MTVRVVEDFWTNVQMHDQLIRRCFIYLINKFPNPDGEEDSYNELMVRMMSLNVFSRFDPARLVNVDRSRLRKKGSTERQIDLLIERALKRKSINVDKKFEQFVYKWIEHFLQEAYKKRKNHAARFSPYGTFIDNVHKETYLNKLRESRGSWADKDNAAVLEKLALETEELQTGQDEDSDVPKKSKRGRKKRKYPDVNDVHEIMTRRSENPLDLLTAEETRNRLYQDAVRPIDRKILELKEQGLRGKDIAMAVNCTSQYVSLFLKKLAKKHAQRTKAFIRS